MFIPEPFSYRDLLTAKNVLGTELLYSLSPLISTLSSTNAAVPHFW